MRFSPGVPSAAAALGWRAELRGCGADVPRPVDLAKESGLYMTRAGCDHPARDFTEDYRDAVV